MIAYCILWIIICGCNHIDVKMCSFMLYYKSFNTVTWCGAKFFFVVWIVNLWYWICDLPDHSRCSIITQFWHIFEHSLCYKLPTWYEEMEFRTYVPRFSTESWYLYVLTLILLMWRIGWAHNNAKKIADWQMGCFCDRASLIQLYK